jgi:hypothetical protein
MSGGGNFVHYDGLNFVLPAQITPTSFSYWARQDVKSHGTYVTLHDTAGAPSLQSEVAFVFFQATGGIVAGYESSGAYIAPYALGVWYFVEFEFDWSAKVYSVSVNGGAPFEDIPFRGEGISGIRQVNLYHFSDDVTGSWDELRAR